MATKSHKKTIKKIPKQGSKKPRAKNSHLSSAFLAGIWILLLGLFYLLYTYAHRPPFTPSVTTGTIQAARQSHDDSLPTPRPTIVFQPKSEKEMLAEHAMKAYLEIYKDGTATDDPQISDYTIHGIKDVCTKHDNLYFTVVFSIKPIHDDGIPIIIDNGYKTSDLWIRDQSGIAEARKIDTGYMVSGIASGVPGNFFNDCSK